MHGSIDAPGIDPAPPRGFRTLALGALALTFALVALGGAVRATDSGLACPDWPFCYGAIIPRQRDIPDGSRYTLWNVWLEHSHRLVASGVGVAIAVLVVWALARHRHHRVVGPAVVALGAVVVQATLGALVVVHLLRAELVSAHLAMSLVVLGSLIVLVASSSTRWRWRSDQDRSPVPARASLALALVVLTQAVVGGQVTGLHAGLAYGTDPLRFDGHVLPPWPRDAAGAFHVAHRALAVAVAVGAVAYLAWVVRRRRHQDGRADTHPYLPIAAGALVVVIAAQVTLGVVNLVAKTPPELVTAHLAGASWVWAAAVCVAVLERLRPRLGSPEGDRSDGGQRRSRA